MDTNQEIAKRLREIEEERQKQFRLMEAAPTEEARARHYKRLAELEQQRREAEAQLK